MISLTLMLLMSALGGTGDEPQAKPAPPPVPLAPDAAKEPPPR